MKILLVGINSQYVHLNLAIRYLRMYVEKNAKLKIDIYETNINNQLLNIITDIYEKSPDILIFSTYIWNREYILDIILELKKILPFTKICVGGPEVSYEWEELLRNYKEIDYVLIGEGEKVFLNFLTQKIENIKGVVYRENELLKFNGPEELIENLDIIPFPYTDEELGDNTRIFYYESSRGCPFSCSYCLSSIDKSVRYYSIERVKQDLKKFLDSPIKLLKFIDRTFNLKKERFLAIWKYMLDNYKEGVTFHFEINANIFDDEILEFLKKVPKGYFQFEIGVQTINEESMNSISRINDLKKLEYNVKKINKNIHLHLDLIAGLPYETYEKFKISFNYVYNLEPEMIQLGFLKLLKGTRLYIEREKYEYKYFSKPPYEVFSNKFIEFNGISRLKKIEKILDWYYNSEKFKKSVNWLINYAYKTPFEFYEELTYYFERLNYLKINHKEITLFNVLYDFCKWKKIENLSNFVEHLKFDFLMLGKPGSYPVWFKTNKDETLYNEILKNGNFKSIREGHKNSELEKFGFNIFTQSCEQIYVFFDYRDRSFKIIES